jgi:hypothetical protein
LTEDEINSTRTEVAKDMGWWRGAGDRWAVLRVTRGGAVKARTAALCQLGDLIVTAPVREQLAVRKTLGVRARLCARLRPDLARLEDPARAVKAALRSTARLPIAPQQPLDAL